MRDVTHEYQKMSFSVVKNERGLVGTERVGWQRVMKRLKGVK